MIGCMLTTVLVMLGFLDQGFCVGCDESGRIFAETVADWNDPRIKGDFHDENRQIILDRNRSLTEYQRDNDGTSRHVNSNYVSVC